MTAGHQETNTDSCPPQDRNSRPSPRELTRLHNLGKPKSAFMGPCTEADSEAQKFKSLTISGPSRMASIVEGMAMERWPVRRPRTWRSIMDRRFAWLHVQKELKLVKKHHFNKPIIPLPHMSNFQDHQLINQFDLKRAKLMGNYIEHYRDQVRIIYPDSDTTENSESSSSSSSTSD
jgi:hypothetical protein